MALALIRKSTLAVAKESTFGTLPSMTSADVISLAGVPNFNSNFDQIENPIIKNTISKQGTLRGAENVSGDIMIPLRGSGTAGTAPDGDVIWECGIGVKNTSTASTTHASTPCTTTSIVLVSGGGANFAVGDAVLIGGEITWVTAKATDTLTVSPALSTAPGFGASVGAGVHYKLTSTRPSFAAKFWRGDITREDYTGLVMESFDIDFATGQHPVPKFAFQGKAMANPTSEAYGLGTPSFDTTTPLVARNMVVTIGGVSYAVSNIALSVKYDIYKRLAVTTSGTQDIQWTARAVTGSFSLLYEDKTVEDAFRNDTQSELRVVCGSTAGNIFAFRIPKIRYSDVSKSEDGGAFKYDVSFSCESTNLDDELTSVSAL